MSFSDLGLSDALLRAVGEHDAFRIERQAELR